MGYKKIFTVFLILSIFILGFSWENHTLITYITLSGNFGTEKVTVKSIEDFLHDNEKEIFDMLYEADTEFSSEIKNYKPIPEELKKYADNEKNIVKKFFYLLRINPEYSVKYFLKEVPGNNYENYKKINFKDIAYADYFYPDALYSEISTGNDINSLEIISTASDEPDYGFDIGLFDDNDTYYGKIYGFGDQSFGNPKVIFGSQAPFHMGFYNESGIIYFASPSMKNTYPELRIRQFEKLAQFAYSKGEMYWAYRFAGWALHYIQDITMPYHSAIMPGKSTFELLWVAALDAVGIKGPYNNVLDEVTNKHIVFERFQMKKLYEDYEKGADLSYLKVFTDDETEEFDDYKIRSELSNNSKKFGKDLDKKINKAIYDKEKYNNLVNIYDSQNIDLEAILKFRDSQEYENLYEITKTINHRTALYTYSFYKKIFEK
ncbi:MAG TPA: hypothetical protein PLS66_09650 [Tepiditoga sp.]|mgnify:CR=1 FL=1|nr:hypothetical protein [Tepiditoga sp.]